MEGEKVSNILESLPSSVAGRRFIYGEDIENHYSEMSPVALVSEVLYRISLLLANGVRVDSRILGELFRVYTPVLLEDKNVKAGTQQLEETVEKYVLPRLLAPEDIDILRRASRVEITFTSGMDIFLEGLRQEEIEVRRPSKRGRIYAISVDDEKTGERGIVNLRFIVPAAVSDNNTALFELLSFIGAYTRYLEEVKGESGINIVLKGKGLVPIGGVQSVSGDIDGLPPIEKGYGFEHSNPFIDLALKLRREYEIYTNKTPDMLLIGNTFSFPLVIGMYSLDKREVGLVYKRLVTGDEKDWFENQIEVYRRKMLRKGMREDEVEKNVETIIRFLIAQKLNRYEGEDPNLMQLKRRIQEVGRRFSKPFIYPTYTVLGEEVHFIDFSQIDEEILNKMPENISVVFRRAREEEVSAVVIPYPVGDMIVGAIKAFKAAFPSLGFVGFWGKVGGYVNGKDDFDLRRGRVVYPEFVGRIEDPKDIMDFNGEEWRNGIIIPNPDKTRLAIAVNSVLLESLHDLGNLNCSPLLEMEAYYMKRVCDKLGIPYAALYYVSDVTVPNSVEQDLTILKSLGVEGTLAALETPIGVLSKILSRLQ